MTRLRRYQIIATAFLATILVSVVAAPAAHATAAAQAPGAPQDLMVTAITSSQVTLTWQAPAGGTPAAYQILRAQGRQSYRLRAAVSTTTFTDTGLTASTVYNYQLRAIDAAGGVSTLSNVASAVTHRAGTTTPTGVACLVEFYPSGPPASLTAVVVLTNTGSATVDGWRLRWTLPAGTAIGASGWGATYTQSGTTATAASMVSDAVITPGDDIEFGYTSSGSSTAGPSGFAMNASPCAIG